MKTANSTSRQLNASLLRQIGGHLPIDRAFAQFRGALVYVDQFGLCAGLIMGLFTLISVLLQTIHAGAEKGVL